jgi:dTMP kinase
MMNDGHLITLEGGDGSGKSTVMDFLFTELQKRGVDVVKTREPGGTALSDEVRKILLLREKGIDCCSRAELLLFLAARAQHVEELILPSLIAGKVVLCDRFNDSSIAYQGFARNLGLSTVSHVCDFAAPGISPTLTLLLDIEPYQGIERVKQSTGNGELDRIEEEEISFHEQVRCGFLLLAEQNPKRMLCIDASQSREKVCEEALSAVLHALKLQMA